MVAGMGGLDVRAFSGGIGEHDTVLRAQVCERLAWLGVALDPVLNTQAVGNEVLAIHSEDSRVQVWVVPTDEGFVAAKEAAALIT
jgi:acetate kinase